MIAFDTSGLIYLFKDLDAQKEQKLRHLEGLGGPMVIPAPAMAEIGVAPSSLASAAIWREWFGCARDDRTPAAPWCCVRIMPAMAVYPSAAAWLGAFERCAAWAWLGRG